MLRLTLRTLLAYLDDTLPPADARQMGQKVAENPTAQELVERIRKVSRRRGLSTPPAGADGSASDPNTVAEYLSDALSGQKLTDFEAACLEHDVHLAEVAACHQILTMVLSEPLHVPPTARTRMYKLVKGKESIPDRKPKATAAVGGADDDHPADGADDSDAPLLLGLSSQGKDQSPGREAGYLLTAAGLLAAFAVAGWMALPHGPDASPDPGPAVALAPTPKPPAPATAPEQEKKEKPKPIEAAPPPKPDSAPAAKTEPTTPPPPEPAPMPEPKKEPPVDLVPTVALPRAERGPVGRLERPANVVVLTRQADGDPWSRVSAIDPTVFSAQSVVSLPGYRTDVTLDAGVKVDLWGNLPDLLNAPGLLGSRVTFHPPADGFDADLSVHTGRVYLRATKPAGGKIRLRFAGQVWDVALLDDKTDAAFEVVRTLTRGRRAEPPAVDATLAVLAGSAGLTAGYKAIPAVTAGEVVTWDGKGKGLEGPKKLDPMGGKTSTYFSKFPLTTEEGKRVNAALDELSRRLADPGRAKAVFAEMLQGRTDPAAVAAARVGVFGAAAVGDWGSLVDAVNDADRPGVRVAAVGAIQSALANDPDGEQPFRRLMAERYRLTDDQLDTAVRMLRGFGEMEKKQPETLDLLVGMLDAPAVGLRELAIMSLLTDVATDAPRANPLLGRYDAGQSDDRRADEIKAWKRYAEEWKKKQPLPAGN